MFDESQKGHLWATPTSFVYDKKFDTALRKTSIRAIREVILSQPYNALPFEAKYLLRHADEHTLMDSETSNRCYARILSRLLVDSSGLVQYSRSKNLDIGRILRLAKANLRLQSEYSLSCNHLPSSALAGISLSHKLNTLNLPLELLNAFALADRFRRIVDQLGQTRKQFASTMSSEERISDLVKNSRVHLSDMECTVSWTSRFCVVSFHDGETFLLPVCYILMIHNKLCDLISVLTLILYQEGVCHPAGSYRLTCQLVKELARLAEKYGDRFAVISGNLESIVIGETLKEIEDWDNVDLLDNVSQDCMAELRYQYYNSRLQHLISSASIPLRNELGCLSKIVGHPFVDMKAGAEKLYKRTTEVKELTYESISWVVNKAKETFVTNYLTRHRRWPKCQISCPYPGKDPLMRAMLANKDPKHPSIASRWGDVSSKDWARVEFEPCLEFQQLDNVIPFLKDKSISVFRNQAVRQYLKGSKARHKWEDTRLLLYYLLNPLKKLDHQEFLTKYTDATDLDELADYLIIRLVPKEKEHKIAFRGFGIKTYHDRLRNLAQEKNMAHFLSLYCDEQSMTMGEIEISKKLYAFRTILRAYKGHRVLYVNFDSTGWNNCFRDESVNPVVRETVSKIMGNDCMHRIHEAYQKSLFLIPDGDVTYSWGGQDGGIEGLNQYAWVWVYVNQIKYAMKDLPVRYHMYCKGDDMRLAILIRPELLDIHDMGYWHKLIVNSVEMAAREFGHKIKVQESYGSEKYFTFSKSASIGQIELPQGFRKIQKVYGANNAMIASLDEYIASTFSNAHSACRTMTNTYGPYFVALIWSYYYIIISPSYNKCSDTELAAVLLIPNMLGGFPIIYLHNMRVRAESDLLSPFLAMIQFCERNYPQIAMAMKQFLLHERPAKPDFRRILKDPYSLNIRSPVSPTSLLRSFILPALKHRIKNEDIKALISASSSRFNNEIIASLASARPFDAKIMSTIYSATPEGVLGELIRKFESGRSILELVMIRSKREQINRQFRRVLDAEIRLQEWRSRKIRGDHHISNRGMARSPPSGCPAEWATQMRNQSWKTEVTGISMPPLQHQVSLFRPVDVQYNDHAQRNHFLYQYTPPEVSLQPGISPHWMVGPNDPFLGYRTRTGNISPTVSFMENDPLIIKVRNLLDLYSWVMKTDVDDQGLITSSNVDQLLTMVLAMYTDVSPQDLAPFSAKRKSGTVQHHARAPRFRESIVPNVLSNWYHNVVGKSDSHINLRDSDNHYTVNFLHIMCEVIHLLHVELETSDTITTPRVCWAVTRDCEFCTTPIRESAVVLGSLPSSKPPPNVIGCQKLDNISKRVILQSYTDFQEAAFKDIDQDLIPSDPVAELAVASEFICHMYHTHTRLQERFSNHVLTSAGHKTLVNLTHSTTSRQIGYTELKKMSTQALADCLTPVIVEFITFKIRDFSIDTLLSQLQRIATSELPWLPMLDAIHKVGRLGDLVRLVARITRSIPFACFESPMTASPYIGYALARGTISGGTAHRISIRTYMDIETIKFELDRFLSITKWKLLRDLFFDLTKLIIPGMTSVSDMADLCRRALYVCAMEYDSYQLAHDLAGQQQHQDLSDFLTVDLTDYAEVTTEGLELCTQEEEDPTFLMYSWLKSKFPAWPWPTCEDEVGVIAMHQPTLDVIERQKESLSLQIGISDISASIAVLRARGRQDIELDDLRDDSSRPGSSENGLPNPEITRFTRGFHPGIRVFTYNGPTSTRGTSPVTVCEEQDFSHDKIILDEAHGHRLYGSATTSMSKLDYVLRSLGFKSDMPDSMLAIITADGAGGFVEYFSTFTQNSVFVFNTLPDRIGANIFPYAAVDILRYNNNLVNTDLVDSGIYDLTETATIEAIIRTHPGASVVTCDADVKWNDRASHEQIIFGTARVYLASSKESGLFVCKANLGFATSVCDLLSTLRRYCSFVWIVRCPGSNLGGEVYIVAFRIERVPTNIMEVRFVSTDDERAMLSRWAAVWFRELENVVLDQPPLRLFPPRLGPTKRRLMDLPPSFVAKLTSRCGVVLNIAEIMDPALSRSVFRRAVMVALATSSASLWDNIQHPQRHKLKGVGFHQTSQAHKIHLCMQWITIIGVQDLLRFSTSASTIGKHHFRTMFHQRIDELPDSFPMKRITSQMYKTSFRYNGVSFFSPYQRYMDGARLAQMVLSHEDSRRWPPETIRDTWFEQM